MVNFTFAVIIALTLLRVFLLFVNGMPLYADEAQYWLWSKDLDWGYYSKPPLIALLIKISTSLFGDSEAVIRLFSPILHMCTAVALYILGRKLYSKEVGCVSALIFITLPSVFLSSSLISTDVPLLLIWTCALYAFIKAIERHHSRSWLVLGALIGVGMMTKYHFGIFIVAGLIYVITIGKFKSLMTNPYVYGGAAIAIAIFSFNLYWNYQHGFVSMSHTAELAGLYKNTTYKSATISILKFFGDQAAVFGPFLLLLFGWIMFRSKDWVWDNESKLLVIFTLTFLAFIAVIAASNSAHANWAAPAYISATILVASWISKFKKWDILKYNTAFHIIAGMAIMFSPFFLMNHDLLPPKMNPYNRLIGFREMGSELKDIANKYNNKHVIFATDDRKTYSMIAYYGRPQLERIKKWADTPSVHDHFDLTARLDTSEKTPIIFVSKFLSAASLKNYLPDRAVSELKTLTMYPSVYKAFLIE